MNYIIFDLEWNRFAKAVKQRCPDEIIQIGAVRADENLHKTGELNLLIRPTLYDKIEPTIQNMTGLRYDRLMQEGVDFNRAMKEFRAFMGKSPVLLSWGIYDAIILRNNCKYYNPNMRFDFLKQFVDLQYYAAKQAPKRQVPAFNQLGLATAADNLGISYTESKLHDAYVDAALTFAVFERIFDREKLADCMMDVSQISAANHPYKATAIVDLSDPLINRGEFRVRCPECGKYAKKVNGWDVRGKKFTAFYHCNNCGAELFSSVAVQVRLGHDVQYKKKVKVLGEEKPPKD